MDVNDLRTVVTVLSFVAFLGIVRWALSRRNKQRFDEAAMLPFADQKKAPPAAAGAADIRKAPR